jgi:hypothetical protein
MSIEDIVRLIFSFLGGGLVAGLLNWLRTARSERTSRRIEFVRSQLQELYGPLQFFTSCNAQLLGLSHKLNEAYKQEYIGKQWSQEYNTRERVSQRETQTIEIANQYAEQAVQNNKRILEILTAHYDLIEPADLEVCAQFIVHYTRLKTEIDEAGRLKTPDEIYRHLGGISLMPEQFIQVVDTRFTEKKTELEKILR